MNTKDKIYCMTLRSKLPLHLYQKYFLAKDSFESLLSKIEVVVGSNAILYSIRILIVLLALLMGYIHTPKNNNDVSNIKKIEVQHNNSNTLFKDLTK